MMQICAQCATYQWTIVSNINEEIFYVGNDDISMGPFVRWHQTTVTPLE